MNMNSTLSARVVSRAWKIETKLGLNMLDISQLEIMSDHLTLNYPMLANSTENMKI